MKELQLVVTAFVGLAAGVLNYAAASGSIVPFLVMVWFGIPMPVANATVLAATPLSFLRALWEIKDVPLRVMAVPLVFSALASMVGAFIVAELVTPTQFRAVTPYVLVGCVVVLLFFQRVRQRIDDGARRERFSPKSTRALLTMGYSVTSLYAGAFGASVGVMILTVASRLTSWPWKQINATKNLLCLVTSGIGFVVYAASDLVLWPVWAVLAVSMAVGGVLGQKLTDHLPAQVLRVLVATVTTIAAGALVLTS
ncbi:sulfite exporter TauE/SafE family protein [Kibdelosporangium philippinense]|uniref:Probable membrane transporter protein n=1 Tax=Kibdelosporangium philippinense TaxID=211113 RepID=A0ABS8ZHF8_9PSEU|nr:sulfite exporter TauE/SafE family protein [Kibdelosporangium philippinense]MCE7006922.1 sulfite exporter TauE/SafE family protein [Kibdelosporangium philippinense]